MTRVLNVLKKSVTQFILVGGDDLHGSALDGLNCVAQLARQCC